jgi:hypothetical protein
MFIRDGSSAIGLCHVACRLLLGFIEAQSLLGLPRRSAPVPNQMHLPRYTLAATSASSGRTLDATVPITLPPRGRQ